MRCVGLQSNAECAVMCSNTAMCVECLCVATEAVAAVAAASLSTIVQGIYMANGAKAYASHVHIDLM